MAFIYCFLYLTLNFIRFTRYIIITSKELKIPYNTTNVVFYFYASVLLERMWSSLASMQRVSTNGVVAWYAYQSIEAHSII